MPTSTATKSADYLTASQSKALALFVPNHTGVDNIIVDSDSNEEFYSFCEEYFFGVGTLQGFIHPYAYAELMRVELEELQFGSNEYASDAEYTVWTTPQQWITKVVKTFGEDTIIVCGHYE